MADAAEFFAQQETALIVRVPEAEPVVGRWRERYDVSAAAGVPPHVTVLYPWIPIRRIAERDLDALRSLATGFEPFTATFDRIERVPEVIWLRPDDDTTFRDLTAAVWSTWPEFPPYDGRFDDVIPHLTVAEGDVAQMPDTIEDEIRPRLPIRTLVTEIELLAHGGERWMVRETFPLGG